MVYNMTEFNHFVVILGLCVALNASSALAAATGGRSVQEAFTGDFNEQMNSPRNGRQFNIRRIPTVTITHVFTVTKITNVGVVCAKLVNVTGQCNRRRRGFWLGEDEEPIILSFDDEVNRAIDILYTPTLDVESTAEPVGHVTFRSGRSDDRYTSDVISSSMTEEETGRHGGDDNVAKPRLYFQELADIMQSIYQRLRPQTRTTVTETIIQTFTIATKTTTTATFFIQRCTPSPFPFRICNHGHKSSSSSSSSSISSSSTQQSSIDPTSTHHHHSEQDHTHSHPDHNSSHHHTHNDEDDKND